jgi:NAD+ kinase
MRVGVVGHRGYAGLPDVLRTVNRLAPALGLEMRLEESLRDLGGACAVLDDPSALDAVLSLGGDGTFLRGARLLDGHPAPILGVNLGRLGFLTTCQPDDLEHALGSLAAGDYSAEARMALRAHVVGAAGADRGAWTALNDVVLHKGGFARMLRMTVDADGETVATYAADGIVVSTPTGSTAYSLSAGGPIVVPTVESIILTAISAHTLAIRPLVLPPTARLAVRADGAEHELLVTVDGQQGTTLGAGESLVITRAPRPVLVVRLRGATFFARLRHKLGWGGLAERDDATNAG